VDIALPHPIEEEDSDNFTKFLSPIAELNFPVTVFKYPKETDS